MAGAYGYGQGIAAGAAHEFFHFFRSGVGGILRAYLYFVLYAGQSTKLRLYHYAALMSIFNNFSGLRDVLLEGMAGIVDHNGSKSAVDAGLAGCEICAVVQMQNDRDLRIQFNSSLYHLYQIDGVGILSCACGSLKDQGGLKLCSCLGDTLHDLHVVDVECADSISAVIGLLEHLG